MATGRTVPKWWRVYADGYDLSGQARQIGPLQLEYEEADLTALSDTVKGYLPNHATVNIGTLNAVFNNTATTGIHTVLGTAGQVRTMLVAMGIQGAPAAGDPTFGGQFTQKAYTSENDGGAAVVSLPFSGWASDAASLLFASPYGQLLHALGAETVANSANSNLDNPTANATNSGGYLIYHVTAGNGTATISVDDSANNSAWLALSGATTGSINCAVRQSGMVAISPTATVRRYLRWQVAFGSANTVTFVLSFHRGFP